jgi:hypothetical protein
MTKINFTDAHLQVIEQALEVFTRLRLGQFDYALDEAFPDATLSWDERQEILKFLRGIVMPEPPVLRYDGHGGYYDQYDNSYGEDKSLDPDTPYDKKWLVERANKIGISGGTNSSWGICNEKVGNGRLAYEIRQTIRQYLAVKKNDGYFEHMFVSYDDPLKITREPLPIIEGFVKEKVFVVEDAKINKQLDQLFGQGTDAKWPKMWKLIEENCGLPDDIESSRRRLNFNEETNKWELILEKPTKKLKQWNESKSE